MSKQRVRNVDNEELDQGTSLIGESGAVVIAVDEDDKSMKTSYGLKTICYAATISVILSLACFGLASTFGRKDDEIPIQLFEEGAAQAAANRSPITQTMQYRSRPYLASFLDKDLYMDGTKDGVAPAEDTRYHIKFFDKADFVSTSLFYFSTSTNVGSFDSINEDGDILLSHGEFCKKAQKESSGVIKISKGDEMELVDVVETEPCVYEYRVTTPFYDPVTVDVPPPPNPDGVGNASINEPAAAGGESDSEKKKKNDQKRAYSKETDASIRDKCSKGFYEDHKGRCLKKLKKKDEMKIKKSKGKSKK